MIKNTRATTLQGAEEHTAVLVKILKNELTKKKTHKQTIDVRENGDTTTIDDFYAGNNPKFETNDLGKAFRFKVWVSRGRQKTFYKAVLASPEPVSDAELEQQTAKAPPPEAKPEPVDWAAKDRANYRMSGIKLVASLYQSFVEVNQRMPSQDEMEKMVEATCNMSETFVVNYLTKGLQAACCGQEADKQADEIVRGQPADEDIPY